MNLSIHSLRRHRFFSALCISVILSQLSISIPAHAGGGATQSQVLASPAVKVLLISIVLVNKAMREAAENPMDKWRRQNVRHAMGLLPAAIIGVAKEFKSNKFHDQDYPIVQKLMAGYVDVNAPDRYQKFLKNPSKKNIPAMSPGIPKSIIKEAESKSSAYAVFDGKKGAPQAASADKGFATTETSAPQPMGELVDLAAQESSGSPAKPAAPTAYTTFDAGSVPTSTGGASVQEGLTVPAKPATAPAQGSVGSSLMQGVQSDLTVIRVERENSGRNPAGEALSDESFFKERKEPEKKPKKRDRRSEFKLPGKFFAVSALWNLWVTEAEAAGGEGGCKGCGGEGEGKGGGAADILFGLAAIMAAAAPMVAAAIQADADKQIAKTQRASAKELAELSQETTLQLSDNNKQLAQQQAASVERMAQENNAAATQRMNMQLAEIEKAALREDSVRTRDFNRQQAYDAERVRLAEKQAVLNQQYQQRELSIQLTQAGLSPGTQSVSANGGNRLVSNRVTPPTTTNMASYNSGPYSQQGLGGFTGAGVGGVNNVQTRAIASDKLLSSVAGNPRGIVHLGGVAGEEEEDPTKPKLRKRTARGAKRTLTRRAVASNSVSFGRRGVSRGIYGSVVSPLVGGSTRDARQAAVEVAATRSDLSTFQRGVAGDESFAGAVSRGADARRKSLTGDSSSSGLSGKTH